MQKLSLNTTQDNPIKLPIPSAKCIEAVNNYGKFLAEPLEPGYGITLGNALRRVLLSSLPGAAITWVKIDGVQHEFSPLPHIKEDVVEFLLNVKQIRFRSLSHQPGKLLLDAAGEGKVYAGNIEPSADFQIANPELYLATLDSREAKFRVEFNIELGRGYSPAGSAKNLPVGALPVDSIFTPVYKVNFSDETINPGREGSPERLILEVWTDGTISPSEAVSQAGAILIDQFSPFKELIPLEEREAEPVAGLPPSVEFDVSIGKLGLSTRSCNSLARAGILTLGQLIEKNREGLPPLPGLGAKSQKEVSTLLASLEFPVEEKEREKKRKRRG
jgi:DNA-directed RNA polymerase subunit alpha